MFYQSRQDVIVVCLDIDDTILNWKTSLNQNNEVDFNGESGPLPNMRSYNFKNQDTKWHQLLNDLKQACEIERVKLIVHIISAKEGGDVDCTVDAVVKTLYPFLESLDCNGHEYTRNLWNAYWMPAQYLYAKHHHSGITKHRSKNDYVLTSAYMPLHEDDLTALPSIHIVKGNRDQGRANSKAAAMQYIEAELRKRGKNPLGMIMVDDRLCFEQEVKGAGYQFICAAMLREATEHHERNTRATYTTKYLMPRISNAVNQILARWRLQKQQMYCF